MEDVREYIKELGDEDAIAGFRNLVWVRIGNDDVASEGRGGGEGGAAEGAAAADQHLQAGGERECGRIADAAVGPRAGGLRAGAGGEQHAADGGRERGSVQRAEDVEDGPPEVHSGGDQRREAGGLHDLLAERVPEEEGGDAGAAAAHDGDAVAGDAGAEGGGDVTFTLWKALFHSTCAIPRFWESR